MRAVRETASTSFVGGNVIYTVLVMRGGAEKVLADALAGVVKPRRVFVVGMTESDALSSALSGQQVMEIDEPPAEELLRFTYSELIGTEGVNGGTGNWLNVGARYNDLIALAKNRAALLQSKNPSPLARAAA